MARKLKVYEQSMSGSSYTQAPTIILKGQWLTLQVSRLVNMSRLYVKEIRSFFQKQQHQNQQTKVVRRQNKKLRQVKSSIILIIFIYRRLYDKKNREDSIFFN